ncbi:antitoxin [Streptomyces mayteni]
MKTSMSLPQDDLVFMDQYAARTSAASRSAVTHAAIDVLRAAALEADYVAAFEKWSDSDDSAIWDQATGDGLTGTSR